MNATYPYEGQTIDPWFDFLTMWGPLLSGIWFMGMMTVLVMSIFTRVDAWMDQHKGRLNGVGLIVCVFSGILDSIFWPAIVSFIAIRIIYYHLNEMTILEN